jgi:hypothetical protein
LNDVSIEYLSPKYGLGVELCSLPRNSIKPCSSLEVKTYLFTGTAIEFNNVKAWKMTEVGNKPEFRSR